MQTTPPGPAQAGHAARARHWHHEADLLVDSADDGGLTNGQRAELLRQANAAARRAQRERFRAGKRGPRAVPSLGSGPESPR